MKRLVFLLMLSLFPLQALAAETPAADGAVPQAAAPEAAAPGEKRKPVKINDDSVLPLRVLTRAMSSLYKEPNENSAVVQSNLPTFSPYYVYTRPGGEDRALEKGWYEVGPDNRGTISGWLKTSDVFEWKQTMVVSYTHPEYRKPVLMFDSKDTLQKLLGEGNAERTAEADKLYATIDSGGIPQGFPVVSVEPKRAVDFLKHFYMLPILNFEQIAVDGREGRLLEIAAVGSGADAREKTDIRENKEYAQAAAVSSAQAASSDDVAKSLKFDVVWVVDTTRSMQPFITSTRELVEKGSRMLAADENVSKNLRFGIWAYRDPVKDIPDIEYLTKNFTPELQNIDSFSKTIAEVKETTVDSVDYPEDVFSGVADAVTKTAWTPGAVRIVILVGDAPSHEKTHKWNISGHDEEGLRTLLSENKVTMLSLQIRPSGAKKHQKVQERQFSTLARNPGTQTAAYFSVPGSEMPAFARSTQKMLADIAAWVQTAQSGKLTEAVSSETAAAPVLSGELAALLEDDDDAAQPNQGAASTPPAAEPAAAPAPAPATAPAPAPATASAPADAATAQSDAGLEQSLKAAVVQWIGSQTDAKPPRDIVAWVTDKDLADPSRASLEVRLLVSKRQLDSLATLLSDMIKAGRTGQITGDDFFTALQSASASAARDPDRIKNAKSLAQSGLVPDFLKGLPYSSRIMTLSNELWNSWSPDEQDNFVNDMDARIAAYKGLHDNPQGWIELNQGADADESVYPIPLELLP
ncbi:hypothetical protein LJC46_04745 [Desulfovibrio sp. OttesenSCG-928-G15]|nr:hypothetical protein [Desulfovibrio sp. OttesenSCG-928-G15]